MGRISARGRFGMACLFALATVGFARAADELIPGDLHLVEPASLAKMLAKADGDSFSLPAGNPRTEGGQLQIIDTGGGSPSLVVALPAARWKRIGRPKVPSGYKYTGAGTLSDPCTLIKVTSSKIKIICNGEGVTLTTPFAGNSGIILTVAGTRYCAEFGGKTLKNDTKQLKRKNAPAPDACAACCNNAMAVSFATLDQPGDCGDLIDAMGVLVTNLQCSGLYTGGGGNSVPLPFAVPDRGLLITAITTCAGQTATLGPTTSTQTGGNNRTCSAPGCLFGAPLAVPNPGTTPTSVCLLNAVGGTPVGSLACNTGATSLTLPLSLVLFLTGDTATDPSSTIAGIQPCPICSAVPTGTCIGGPNNGMACTPGTSALNASYPTSHDCPPDPMFNIGTLPVNFSLSTGTLTWSGTPPTNDTGSTVSVQSRVFSGFCRDTDSTGAFEGTTPATAHQCWENGMAVNAACAGTFESCEQRNNGAFGPAGGANRTITAIGNAMSILSGPGSATLVSIFTIPPTFDPTIDAAGDLPGPGAGSDTRTLSLCPTASPCP